MKLTPEPLTREAFAPFGKVLQVEGAAHFPINGGMTDRVHALAEAETDPEGKAILSIFRSRRWPDPIRIEMLERHPLGSQAFMPLSAHDWLVVVAEQPEAEALRCYRARGDQGVQYATGVWHHPFQKICQQVIEVLHCWNHLLQSTHVLCVCVSAQHLWCFQNEVQCCFVLPDFYLNLKALMLDSQMPQNCWQKMRDCPWSLQFANKKVCCLHLLWCCWIPNKNIFQQILHGFRHTLFWSQTHLVQCQ